MPFSRLTSSMDVNPQPTTKATSKPPKPRSLPPPGEAFGAEKRDAKLKAKAKGNPATKKSAAPKKAPAKPKAAAKKTGDGGQVDAGNGITKSAAAKKGRGRPSKEKVQSIFSMIWNETTETPTKIVKKAVRQTRIAGKESVLMRRTAYAEAELDKLNREAEQKKRANKKKEPVMAFNPLIKAKQAVLVEKFKPFRVMDLPKELRTMIWREAVVCKRGFVWPEEKRFQEQPDLAMTCRQVRQEVLEIYYAENIFGIHLLPQSLCSKADPAGVGMVKKWAEAIEGTKTQPGWFSSIRNWGFMYDPPVVKGTGQMKQAVDTDFTVTVSFSKRQQNGVAWDASVEVHREACCVLPVYQEYGLCQVRTVPAWLNDPVIGITAISRGGSISPKMIFELVEKLQKDVDWIRRQSCLQIPEGVEM